MIKEIVQKLLIVLSNNKIIQKLITHLYKQYIRDQHWYDITRPRKDLDYEIAKRKGWEIIPEQQDWLGSHPPTTVWRLRDPRGNIRGTREDPSPEGFVSIPGYTSNITLSYTLLLDLERVDRLEDYSDITGGANFWVHQGLRGRGTGGQMMVLIAVNWIKLFDAGLITPKTENQSKKIEEGKYIRL